MKNKFLIKTFAIVIVLIFILPIIRCKKNSSTPYKQDSIGLFNQVTVVSSDSLYQNVIQPALMDSLVFGQQFKGIYWPPEVRLVTRNFNYESFKKYKHLRNILYIKNGEPKIEFFVDSVSKPQSFVVIQGNSDTDFKNIIAENADTLINSFVNADMRYVVMIGKENQVKEKPLLDRIGFEMVVPDKYKLIKNEEDFTWYRKDVNEDIINLMFYTIDAIDSLKTKDLLLIRNSFNRRHVESPKENDFARTDTIYTPSIDTLSVSDKKDVFDIRGNWSFEKYQMGGPFITRIIHDKIDKKLYFADAFMYAPTVNYVDDNKSKKRTYLIELEGLLSTFKKK